MGAVVVRDLTKKLGRNVIFNNINLEIHEGEIYALLALKGQGKTTLARLLFNYIKANRGNAYIFDMDTDKDSKQIKEIASYAPEEMLFQDNIRAISLFKKTLSSRKMKNTDELYFLIDYFDFNPKLKIIDMDYTEKKLFSIINALIAKPKLIVLDEPAKYLNLLQVSKLYDYLRKLRDEEGLTAFVLTESLIEAQNYCDRAIYLHEGEIKDIEYLNDKVANDKIIKIYSSITDINDFISIGARVIKDSTEEKILYYDKDLVLLSKLIAALEIDNYTIEDSSLMDKISAYYSSGVAPREKRPTEINPDEKILKDNVNFDENDTLSTQIVQNDTEIKEETIIISESDPENKENPLVSDSVNNESLNHEDENNYETEVCDATIVMNQVSDDESNENKEVE